MSEISTVRGASFDNPIDNEVSGPFVGHVQSYLRSGGDQPQMPAPLLLITTRGRVSGRWHRTAIFYAKTGDEIVVFGSNLAGEKDPNWYSNLLVHPTARIQVKNETFEATARVAEGDEHDRLWELLVETFPPYADHQAKVDRRIGIVVLKPSNP